MRIIGALVTLSLLGYILSSFEIGPMAGTIAEMAGWQFVAVLVLFSLNLVLVSLRFHMILRRFGVDVAFAPSFRANILSHVGGLFFLQMIGQFISRAAFLKKHGVPASAMASITMYEKITSLVAALVFFLGGSLYLLGRQAGDAIAAAVHGVPLVQLLVIAALGLGLSYRFGGLRLERRMWRRLLSWSSCGRVLNVTLLTMVSQGCMVAAYVVVAWGRSSGADGLGLTAAASVVMFVASLPISVSGWGVREMASVYAMGLLGVPAAQAVAISVFVGFAAILSLLVMAAGVAFLRDEVDQATQLSNAETHRKGEIDKITVSLLAIFAAVAVFFQLHIPLRGGLVNVNLADPLALIGGAYFLIHWINLRRWPVWRPPGVNLSLAVMTAALMLAFVVGVAAFGVTPWATNNRLLGWLVILAYVFTGAVMANQWGANGTRRMLETLVVTAAVIGLYITLSLMLLTIGATELRALLAPDFLLLSPNRNAVAFALCLALAAAIALAANGSRMGRRLQPWLAMGAISAGIGLTGSRAGIITMILLWSAGLALRVVPPRRALAALAWAAVLVAIVHLQMAITGSGLGGEAAYLTSDGSDGERMQTFRDGLALWLAHPLFGAGLGAYMADQLTRFGRPLVIHNSTLWMLAEFGVVGTAAVIGAMVPWVRWGLRARSHRRQGFLGLAALLVLGVFAVFSLVHEVYYQRIVWLMLGAILGLPQTARAQAEHPPLPSAHRPGQRPGRIVAPRGAQALAAATEEVLNLPPEERRHGGVRGNVRTGRIR